MPESQKLILLVDDDKDLREIISIKLQRAGFKIEQAENGKLGIAKAKKLKPDLILMDVKMPIMTGVEALSKLRSDPETSSLKVIFLTNLGEPTDENSWIDDKFAKDAGAMGHIRKADDLDKIVERVKQALAA